jgi:2-hydroxychromene-2-carboxylate isomerase
MSTIEYYFTSPRLGSISAVRRSGLSPKNMGARLDIRPVNLGGVWEVSGGVPLAQRSPTRQRFRLIEMGPNAEL